MSIRIADKEYQVSKALLCTQSPYFSATFEGKFLEGAIQSTTLAEIDGVVTVRSVQMLIQWLYLGRIVTEDQAPEEGITATIEFVRFADMCGVTGMESLMAERIKSIILSDSTFRLSRDPETNTRYLTSQHITAASFLPDDHSVRIILARATVEGYLQQDRHKFAEEALNIPAFAVDLLREVKATLNSVTYRDYKVVFKEPISGKELKLH